jgi:hypothetical protein
MGRYEKYFPVKAKFFLPQKPISGMPIMPIHPISAGKKIPRMPHPAIFSE